MAGALIGALRATLGLDSAAFEQGADAMIKKSRATERSITRFGQSMTNLGQTLSVAVTAPFAAFGVTAVQAAAESRDAVGQVEASLKSMGDAAGRTLGQLEALASKQMRQSLYDDDEILRKVTANLLTFGTVSGDNFDRAQQAAIDLAARLKMDLQSATLMVGKALNDPVKGLNALRRTGIQFTADQEEVINAMVAGGDAAGAQAVMLKELERQFGGAARAAREADPMAAVKQSWAEFQETVGQHLLKVMPAITSAIEKVLDAFGRLSPSMQEKVIIFAAVAAAIGPMLIALGAVTTTLAPMLAILKTAAMAGGPVLALKTGFIGLTSALAPFLVQAAIVGAVGYLIYQNWDKVGPVLETVAGNVKDLAVGMGLLEDDSKAAATTLQSDLIETGKVSEEQAGKIAASFEKMQEAAKNAGTIGETQKGPWRTMGEELAKLQPFIDAYARGWNTVVLTTTKSIGIFMGAWDRVASITAKSVTIYVTSVNKFVEVAVASVAKMVTQIGVWMKDRLGAVWDWAIGKIDVVRKAFYNLADAVVFHSYIPDMVDGIAKEMARLDAVMVAPVEKATSKAKKAFRELAEDVKPLLDRLFPEAAAANTYFAEKALIDRAEQSTAITGDTAAEARRRLALEGRENGTIDQLLAEGEAFRDSVAPNIDEVTKSLGHMMDKAGLAKVQVVKSFKDMATDTLDALDRMASAVRGGGFLDILSSLIGLGMQLGSIGAFGKTIQKNLNMPAYANGTGFHPGGLAMVGERGPEVVNLPRGSQVFPNGTGPATRVQVVPSPYFDVVVDGRIMQASPAIAAAGGDVGLARMRQSGSWTLR